MAFLLFFGGKSFHTLVKFANPWICHPEGLLLGFILISMLLLYVSLKPILLAEGLATNCTDIVPMAFVNLTDVLTQQIHFDHLVAVWVGAFLSWFFVDASDVLVK